MIERPILFNGAMVCAILDGRKTQTRRVCKPAEAASLSDVVGIQDPRDFGQSPLEVRGSGWFGDEEGDVQFRSPYGRPGDRLWVKETHRPIFGQTCGLINVDYRADPQEKWERMRDHLGLPRWTPSIHMRREYSRILLDVVSVRVERLQAISEEDAAAEGWTKNPQVSTDPAVHVDAARDWYADLWERINGVGSWTANPWVWVVEFQACDQTKDGKE